MWIACIGVGRKKLGTKKKTSSVSLYRNLLDFASSASPCTIFFGERGREAEPHFGIKSPRRPSPSPRTAATNRLLPDRPTDRPTDLSDRGLRRDRRRGGCGDRQTAVEEQEQTGRQRRRTEEAAARGDGRTADGGRTEGRTDDVGSSNIARGG